MNSSATGIDSASHANAEVYDQARKTLALRRRRAEHFNSFIFGEPAWDVLLQLFVHGQHRQLASLVELEALAGVSHSTMKRWVAILIDEQLVAPVVSDSNDMPGLAITDLGCRSIMDLFSA